MENKELINAVGEVANETAEAAKDVVVNLKLIDLMYISGVTMIAIGVGEIVYGGIVAPIGRKIGKKIKTKIVTRKLKKAKKAAEPAAEEADPMELTEEDLKVE